MRRSLTFIRTLVFCCAVLTLSLSSCHKDEISTAPEVTIEGVSSDVSSVVLRITSEGAEELAYIQIKDLASAPSARALLSAGTSVEVPGGDVEITGLQPGTTYYYAAAASAGDIYSEVVTVEVRTVDASCTFDLTVTGVTSNAVAWRVVPSLDTEPYYVAVLPSSYASSSDEDVHAAVLEQITAAAGGNLEDYLNSNMYKGTKTGSFINLEPATGYLLVAMGLSVDGSLQTEIARADAETDEEFELTFELSATEITATSARVSVRPSDNNATYVWLCQPATNYPGISEDNPDALAEAYVANQGAFLEQGMGLYTGSYDIPGFDVNSDSRYYLFAFGYTPGVGITSSCELLAFDTGHGIVADEFQAEVEVTVTTARRISYIVRPGQGMESIYYCPVVLPAASYSLDAAQDSVSRLIQNQYDLNIDFNPGYTMTDATSSVCRRGEYLFEDAGFQPETDYVIAVIPVSNDGVPADVEITEEVTTESEVTSNAYFHADLIGIYSGDEALEAGLYTESSSSLRGNALALFEVEISADAVHAYYNVMGGDYTNAEEEYKTDDDLMAWVPGNPYTVEVDDHTMTHLLVPVEWYDLDYWDYTLLSWAVDETGLGGVWDRTFIRAISTETDPIQELVDLVNGGSSAAPVLTRIK